MNEYEILFKNEIISVEMFKLQVKHFFTTEGDYIDSSFITVGTKLYTQIDMFPVVYNYLASMGIGYHKDNDFISNIVNEFGKLILAVGKAVVMQSKTSNNDVNSDMYA